MRVVVAGRSSKLSRVQIDEVENLLEGVVFEKHYFESRGDRDLKTPLQALDKTNFFTEELDRMLLAGECDVTIHSAKDLPEPLPKGLQIVAITEGVTSADSLVMQPGETLESLPHKARVATCSVRREEAVSMLRDDLTFVPLRGTIQSRLEQLESGAFDALVMAEAAIVRLQLLHLNRITLPGEVAPLQGRLAVLAREGDTKMERLFQSIDWRCCDEADTVLGTRSLELSGKG